MSLLVDTIAYSTFMTGEQWAIDAIQTAHRIYIPIIVLGELRAGFVASQRAAQNERALTEFLQRPRVEVAYIDDTTTHIYADLFQYLRRAGTPIPINDLWIAALAFQHSLRLLTRDQHFKCLPQISVITE